MIGWCHEIVSQPMIFPDESSKNRLKMSILSDSFGVGRFFASVKVFVQRFFERKFMFFAHFIYFCSVRFLRISSIFVVFGFCTCRWLFSIIRLLEDKIQVCSFLINDIVCLHWRFCWSFSTEVKLRIHSFTLKMLDMTKFTSFSVENY